MSHQKAGRVRVWVETLIIKSSPILASLQCPANVN